MGGNAAAMADLGNAVPDTDASIHVRVWRRMSQEGQASDAHVSLRARASTERGIQIRLAMAAFVVRVLEVLR